MCQICTPHAKLQAHAHPTRCDYQALATFQSLIDSTLNSCSTIWRCVCLLIDLLIILSQHESGVGVVSKQFLRQLLARSDSPRLDMPSVSLAHVSKACTAFSTVVE